MKFDRISDKSKLKLFPYTMGKFTNNCFLLLFTLVHILSASVIHLSQENLPRMVGFIYCVFIQQFRRRE